MVVIPNFLSQVKNIGEYAGAIIFICFGAIGDLIALKLMIYFLNKKPKGNVVKNDDK
jgi:hypothetical protein